MPAFKSLLISRGERHVHNKYKNNKEYYEKGPQRWEGSEGICEKECQSNIKIISLDELKTAVSFLQFQLQCHYFNIPFLLHS